MIETELAAHVVRFLHERHFEVYQEVIAGPGIADIVAKAGPLLWVIECKKTVSFELIEQARRWTPYANMVSLCAPQSRHRSETTVTEILEHFGLGALRVGPEGRVESLMYRTWANSCWANPGSDVDSQDKAQWLDAHRTHGRTDIHAPFRRRVLPHLRNTLREEHKTFAVAGSAASKRWTPYKNTCRDLLSTVKREPGITLKDAITQTETHYTSSSSARASLSRLIEAGHVPGVRMERDKKQIYLYPVKDSE